MTRGVSPMNWGTMNVRPLSGGRMKLRNVAMVVTGIMFAAAAFGNEPTPVPRYAAPPSAEQQPAVAQVSQEALLARQAQHDPSLFLLDVRTPAEFASGHVPGAVNIPHNQIGARLAEVPRDKDVVLCCQAGVRASLAAGVLVSSGYKRLSHLEGDMVGWIQMGRPIERGPPQETPKP